MPYLLAVIIQPIMLALRHFFSVSIVVFLIHGFKYILLALGVGFVSYAGISFALDEATNLVNSQLSGLPSHILGLMTYLGILDCVKIYFAAATACMGIKATTLAGKLSFSKNGKFWA
jgi:hypothetical protein